MFNYRYDEFLDEDLSQMLTNEAVNVPANSPYYVPLSEVPRRDVPSSVLVRTAGSTQTANPDQDCHVRSDQPSGGYDNTTFRVGLDWSQTVRYRAYVRFSIASLPSNPSQVKLRLCIEKSDNIPQPFACGVFRVTSSWVESMAGWNAQPTYDPVAVAQFQVPTNFSNKFWVECDITALYNAWKSGTNNGLVLIGDELAGVDTVIEFASSEAESSIRPQLVVVASGGALVEVASSIAPGPGEFSCNYQTGRLRFNAAQASASLVADYRGIGSAIDARHIPQDCGTTGGSANAYTATYPCQLPVLRRGISIWVTFHANNTGASTLNLNGLGAVAIKRLNADPTNAQLKINTSYLLFYNGTVWEVMTA